MPDWSSPLVGEGKQLIPLAHLEVELRKAPPEAQLSLLKDRDRLTQLVTKLYLARLLAEEAKKNGLDQDQLLQAALEHYRDELLARARLQQIRQGPVPDMTVAARDYYRAHPEEFKTTPEAEISHILIEARGRRTIEEARRLAESVLNKARAGNDFDQLAAQYSEAPKAKENHGRLGWITPERLKPGFSRQVFKLGKGEVGLVERPYGFHVVKVWNIKPPRLQPFDAVKNQIVSRLEGDYRRDRVNHYLDELKRRTLKLNTSVLDAYIEGKREILERQIENAGSE